MSNFPSVIITGAGGNLGRAVTRYFLDQDFHVIGTLAPHEEDKLAPHPRLELHKVDLLDETHTATFLQQIIDKYHHINACLMLAGGFAMGNLADTGSEDLQKMFDLNLKTAYHVARPVFTQMKQQQGGGRMVFVGARPALEPAAATGTLAYALSKSLLFRLAEVINEEGREQQVVATVVAPSIIDTPPNRKAMPEADADKWVSPESLARILHFVCSDGGADLREPVLKVYGGA